MITRKLNPKNKLHQNYSSFHNEPSKNRYKNIYINIPSLTFFQPSLSLTLTEKPKTSYTSKRKIIQNSEKKMGDVHIQNHQQQSILLQNSPISHKNKQQRSIIIPSSSSPSFLDQQENDFFSMLQLNSTSSPRHRHKTSTKRRSTLSSSSERRAKKHSFDQDDLTNNGFSAISLPFSVCGNDLRRCVSTPEQTTPPQDQSNLPQVKEAGLPPLPPNLRRSLSADVSQALNTPLPPNLRRSLSADVSHALNTEETTTVDSLVCLIVMEVLFLCKNLIFFGFRII